MYILRISLCITNPLELFLETGSQSDLPAQS